MNNKRKIDLKHSQPPYMQLANILKGMIAQGQYIPGDSLPSEANLCERYQVSPMTVRRSIKELLDQKLVSTKKGSGTFVRAPTLGNVNFNLEEFYNLFRDKERTKVKILEVLISRADQMTADKLSINAGDNTILIRRVLVRDGDPILYHKEQLIYDPTRPIVEGELEVTYLHGLFAGTGETTLKWGEIAIEAAVLTKEEADVLNTAPLQPAFRLEHTFYDLQERPVSWGRFVCLGERLRFTATVGISNRIRPGFER